MPDTEQRDAHRVTIDAIFDMAKSEGHTEPLNIEQIQGATFTLLQSLAEWGLSFPRKAEGSEQTIDRIDFY